MNQVNRTNQVNQSLMNQSRTNRGEPERTGVNESERTRCYF
jgi:hypothetical protein